MDPSDVIITGSLSVFQQQVSSFGFRLQLFQSSSVHERGCIFKTDLHIIVI